VKQARTGSAVVSFDLRSTLVSQKELHELKRLELAADGALRAYREADRAYADLQNDLVTRIELGARIEYGPLTFHFAEPSLKSRGARFPPDDQRTKKCDR